MKRLLFATALTVAGCGGGSGGSGVQPITSSQPASSDTVLITGKVIDGYVSGATVFIDMNWSLAWEQGEPKTTTDANGNWSFKQSDLNPFFSCYKGTTGPRAIIVDVPAGAVDTTRGVVQSPYRMVFLPAPWLGITTSNQYANITPFTSLFAAAIAQGKLQTQGADGIIPVNESCGNLANNIASNVRNNVLNMGKVFADAGVSINSFYDDFIASGNTVAQSKGELIVDYLVKYKSISDYLTRDLQLEQGADPGSFYGSYGFNSSSLRDIVNGNPDTVAFDIFTNAEVTPPSTNKSYKFYIHVKGLKLRKDGSIISQSCQSSDPYSCPVITGTDSKAMTKASTETMKVIKKQEGDAFVFRKSFSPRTNSYDCQGDLIYSYQPNQSLQLEFVYSPRIENKLALYDCSTGDEGVKLSKRVGYTARSNGYNYSQFVYTSDELSSAVTSNFPYAISHFTKPIESTTLNQQQIQDELNALPYNPKQLDAILTTYTGGRWFLETGSDTEVALLTYSVSTNTYSCVVRTRGNGEIVRQTNGQREQAVAMCYPDTSVF